MGIGMGFSIAAAVVTGPAEAIADRSQQFQKPALVGLVPVDGLAGVAAGGEVIEGAGEFKAQGAGHGVAVFR